MMATDGFLPSSGPRDIESSTKGGAVLLSMPWHQGDEIRAATLQYHFGYRGIVARRGVGQLADAHKCPITSVTQSASLSTQGLASKLALFI
jgi:hypothetical protein